MVENFFSLGCLQDTGLPSDSEGHRRDHKEGTQVSPLHQLWHLSFF